MPKGVYKRKPSFYRTMRRIRLGKKNPMYGKKYRMTKKHKNKIRIANLKEKCYAWKGGEIVNSQGYRLIYIGNSSHKERIDTNSNMGWLWKDILGDI